MDHETGLMEEQWCSCAPKRGDHIRVVRHGLYSHHGIYISKEEVIHFSGTDSDSVLDWSKCAVISTSLEEFLRGGTVQVKIYSPEEQKDLYPVEEIVDYARFSLGSRGYHLVYNNCEHFANVCTLGRFRSVQVERVLSGKPPLESTEDLDFTSFSGFLDSLEDKLSETEQMEKLARLLETVDAKYEDSALGRYVKKVAEELEEHTPEIEEFQDLVSGKLVTAKEKLIARVMQLLHNEEENS